MNTFIQAVIAAAIVAAASIFLGLRLARILVQRKGASSREAFKSRWPGDAQRTEKTPPPRSAIAGLQDFEDKEEGGCPPSHCAGCKGCG